MARTSASAHQVLIVDDDARVRRALTELINATEGFTAVTGGQTQTTGTSVTADAKIAVVGLRTTADKAGLERIRALAEQMPVVAVSAVSSAASAATGAGATAFCEMDGNTDTLIAALSTAAAFPPMRKQPSAPPTDSRN